MCDERLHKIHSNKLNLVHSLHTPQTTTSQRQNTRIELTTKAKRADFLKLKKFLWEKFSEKKRMTLICGLAIILPIYAIQNQELPEVEMFCRHTIGGYQLMKIHEISWNFVQVFWWIGNTKLLFKYAEQWILKFLSFSD